LKGVRESESIRINITEEEKAEVERPSS